MALRRELLPLLLAAAFLLIGPAQALAAPTWLDGERLDAFSNQGVPADVAADAEGNAVAVWVGNGEVRAAYRPRGGDVGRAREPRSRRPDRVDAAARDGAAGRRVRRRVGAPGAVEAPSPVRWARRPSGGGWSAPDTITFDVSFPAISALEAGGDGSVTVMITDERQRDDEHARRRAPRRGAATRASPPASGSRLAVGPDGSALAAASGTCGRQRRRRRASRATYRPPGGPWGAPERSPDSQRSATRSPARGGGCSGTGYTLVFGEAGVDGPVSPPSLVRCADRGPGTGGQWSPPDTSLSSRTTCRSAHHA